MPEPTLFDAERMALSDAIGLTERSLAAYGERHGHWAVAYSGGKDSTTLLSVVLHLIRLGRVAPPRRLTVCYADTRMELPPLAAAAREILRHAAAEGHEVRVAVAPMDKRFFVYMFGRGVPPPNNKTFRWCTRQIKVEPMVASLRGLVGDAGGKVLMLTGVRLGESAARDQRIALSCGRNGAECGQGWYQETLPSDLCDTLAPILHWRACLVWDWLNGLVPAEYRHGYPTRLVAEAYDAADGSPEAVAVRTGCNGCPLANQDTALDRLLAADPERWGYLAPLKELRPLYRWLRKPAQRLRKPGWERYASGRDRPTNRLGPLTMEARRVGLARALDVQRWCNESAPPGAPVVDMLDAGEVARIEELIAAGTWPDRWAGDEPLGDEPYERVHGDGSTQLNLPEVFGA